MASGRQIAEDNVRRLQQWADKPRRPEDWAPYINNGQLNRSAVAGACGFGRSVFVQNPAAKAFMADVETRLATVGILSPQPTEGKRSPADGLPPEQPAATTVSVDENIRRLEREIKRRDERIATMLAEITGLRDRIRRLEHVEMVTQSGRRVVP